MEAFSFRSPSYLIRNPHSYCFRMIVPADLRSAVGVRELRYSLRTGAIAEAKYRARRMAGYTQALFRWLRKSRGSMTQPSKAELKRLLEKYHQECLEEAESIRATGEHPTWVGHGRDEDPLEARANILGILALETREDLAKLKYDRAELEVEQFIEDQEIELDNKTILYNWLCREMMKLRIRYYNTEQRRTFGDYSDEFLANGVSNAPLEKPQEEESYPLRTVIDHFVAERKSGKAWTKKTVAENLAIMDLFVELVGNVSITSISVKAVRDYKESLIRLPANMKKSPQYRDKSPQEILEMDIEKPMSTTSVNKHLRRVSAFLNYAVNNGYLQRNPAEGMKLPEGKREDEYRAEFDDQDLKKLLCSPEYLEDKHRHSYAFWMPLLALYTGCRMEELAQLHLDDIREVEGVWMIDVNDKVEKKVKTPSSIRLVPIHSFLLNDLAFLAYVDSLRAKGETRLFPELTRRRDGYGQTVTKWFTRYKVRCGIDGEGGKKVFHSFRHTFVNRLKQDMTVNDTLISELVGHSVDSITMGRYGKRYRPQILKDAVEKIELGFSLDHLKKSEYVLRPKL